MKNLIALIFFSISAMGFAQLKTDEAKITFHSEKDDITAVNSSVTAQLDVTTGTLKFKVKISDFSFENKTMQKHFNQEGVMNSIEFPTANFEGKITDNSTVDYTADGTYKINVSGKMTIKGVSKEFSTSGKIVIKDGKISAISSFKLDRFEYGVDGKKQSVSQVLSLEVKAQF